MARRARVLVLIIARNVGTNNLTDPFYKEDSEMSDKRNLAGGKLTRREVLQLMAGAAATGVLSACTPATPTPQPTEHLVAQLVFSLLVNLHNFNHGLPPL